MPIVYSPQQRAAPVSGAKQQAVSTGFGQEVGQGISAVGVGLGQYARQVDAFNARVDEASVMEQDNALAEALRPVETGYLNTQGRTAMDAQKETDETWRRTVDEARGALVNDRQRAMFDAAARQREARFRGRADAHLMQQTEVYVSGQEDSHVATLSRDAATLPVGSEERDGAIQQLGLALNHISTRRGLSAKKRAELGFSVVAGVHVATVQQLQNERPDQAYDYLEAYRDQIGHDVYARLLPAVRDDRNNYIARGAVEGFVAERRSAPVEVEDAGGGVTRAEVISPVPAGTRITSDFGPRRAPIAGASTNHGGTDFAVPLNTPVVAALPGVARIRSDPDGFGTYVVVDHGGGRETYYAHLSAATVQDGQRVAQGERLGLSGSSGNSSGPHLHFEFREGGQKRDPEAIIGQTAQVSAAAPTGGVDFATVEDVYDFAREKAGGDWRLQEALERQGLNRLQEHRAQRNDREEEGRRALDAWLAGNPNATPEQIPSSLRNAVSPTYWLSVQSSRTPRPGEGRDAALGNDIFNALLDEAAADPDAFASRDLSGYRGIVAEGQLNTLRDSQRRIVTSAPEGARTPDQVLAAVTPVLNGYVDQVYGRAPSRGRTPEQNMQIATVRAGLMDWADDFTRTERRNPTPEETVGQLRVLIAPVGAPGTNRDLAPRAAMPTGAYLIPRAERSEIVTALSRTLRRAPTSREISREWERRLRSGAVELPANRF